jgi:uncharacterized membrane protein YebE (DUF533 family)
MANWLNQLQSLLGQQGRRRPASRQKERPAARRHRRAGRAAGGQQIVTQAAGEIWHQRAAGWRRGGGGYRVVEQVSAENARQNTPAPTPETAAAPTEVDPRSVRLITALVFAAKSDGHIDDHERANIEAQLRAANIDVQARVLIDQALAQPLDPQRLAEGIVDPQEALEIYYVSCAVIDIDHFMERSYLNALGEALALPKDVRADIEQDIQSQKQALSV